MTVDEQLAFWLEGKPIHNDERAECTPDFSCCNRVLLASVDDRKKFFRAHCDGDHKIERRMLIVFLEKMLEAEHYTVIKYDNPKEKWTE